MLHNYLSRRLCSAITTLFFISPLTAFAALEPQGPENLVNTTSSGYEATPYIVSDQNNNRLIVWSSEDRLINDGPAILGQFYNQYREAVGPEMTLVPPTANIARIPSANDYPHFAITMWKDGSFALAWSEISNPDDETDDDYDLAIQFFNPDGSPSGPAQIVADTTDKEALPALSSNANSLALAWQTFPNRQTKERQSNIIKFQRFNKNGTLNGDTITTVSLGSISNMGGKPAIALNNDNTVLIAWLTLENPIISQEDPNPDFDYKVSGELFAANNSQIGNIPALADLKNYPSEVFTIDLDGDSFLAIWDTGEAGKESPQGRIIEKSGTLGNHFTYTTQHSDIVSGITSDNKGNAFISWSRNNNDGQGKALYIQHVNANGVMGSPTQATSFTNTEENHVSMHVDGNGVLMATWESWIKDDEDAPDIYARSFEVKEDNNTTKNEGSSGGSGGGSLPVFILLTLLFAGLARKHH